MQKIEERVGLIYDVHAPYHNRTAYDMAIKYLKNLSRPKLTKLVLAGDFVDFYRVSPWKQDPNRMSFKREILCIKGMLKDLKSKFPRIPIHYIEGNHEHRLTRYIWTKAPELDDVIDVPSLLNLKHRRIKYISNIGLMCAGLPPYRIGKLFVLHGHEVRVGMGSVNIARLYYLRCHKNVISGHHHKSQKYLGKTIDGKHEGSWCVGTLGDLAEPYLPINEWNNGFAFVDVYDNNFFDVHNKAIIEGNIITV